MSFNFNMCFDEYSASKNKYESRIFSDLEQEKALQNDYKEREIYELLQNAEDAGGKAYEEVHISIDYGDDYVSVSNKGGAPFSEAGFASILRAHQSSKIGEDLIGNKGLGFRSVLNWAREIVICSNGNKCVFSEEIANQKWKQIQEIMRERLGQKDAQLIIDDVNNKVRLKGFKTSLAILSVPKHSYISRDDNYTTKISLKIEDNEDVRKSIIKQINSLNEEILLFLSKRLRDSIL